VSGLTPHSSLTSAVPGATQRTTRYYEIRCQLEPYPEPTAMVVEASSWDEVLKKYPDAEYVTTLGERQRQVATGERPPEPAVARGQHSVQIVSRPLHVRSTRVISRAGSRRQCRVCGRVRLSRSEYAWRRANGYAVWRCQHRRPSRKPSQDVVEAIGVMVAVAVTALMIAL
jgi:hypothetical protein